MKFSCEKSTFFEAISISSRAVSNKSTIALLEGLLISAQEGLTLSGYDLSMGIRTHVDADVIEEGKVILSARLLGDIVRKLPDDIVYVETDEKLMTTIKCGCAVFNLIASPADDFPQMPEVHQENELTLPEGILKSMISQTIFAVSDNESKPIHTGCLFEIENQELHIVAVDGYRLAIRRETLEIAPQQNTQFVVPGNALREIERILDDGDSPITIYPDEKHILFSIGNTILITRLIDGEFLNYRATIPEKSDFTIHVDVQNLITCIERVSLLVSEKIKNPVRISFEGELMKMNCITAIGKSYDECPIKGDIDSFEIGFNSRYLLDALRACTDKTILLQLKGALNPIIMSPESGEKYTYMVLPVRLKAVQ